MKKQKWNWEIDQWFEDKIWSKFPDEFSTPHMFFIIGLWMGFIISAFAIAMLK